MRSTKACAMAVACVVAMWPAGATAQSAGNRRAAETEIMKADEAFCQATIDHDVGRFRSLVAEEATFAGGTPGQTRGLEAIVESWMPLLRPGGPSLTWKPTRAEVLVSGDVGYTVGTWERRAKGADGRMTTARGQYMTVWRKQPDGKWKAVFDTGGEELAKK